MNKMLNQSLFLLLPAIILLSCGKDKNSRERIESIAVKTQTVTLQPVEEKVTFTGKVQTLRAVNLSTKLLGRIEFLKKEEGAKISAGQQLIQISNKDLLAKKQATLAGLKEAEANVAKVGKDYKRLQSLYSKSSATEKEMDDITYALEASKAKVSSLKGSLTEINELLSYARIEAPFDGYVTKKLMEEGDLATPGMPILKVESFNQLKVVIKVPEQDIALLSVGKPVKVHIDGAETVLNGKVSHINPSSLAGDLQFEASVVFEQPENSSLKAGMFAEVQVKKGIGKRVLVAKKDIIQKGQLTGVFTINNQDKATMRWIRLGKEMDDQFEVVAGLTEGEQYIISSQQRISGGEKVHSSNN